MIDCYALAPEHGAIVVSRLGKYLLLEHVNQGGMADVFLAKTFGFGGADQLIALKCIRPEVYADQVFIDMFIEEAKLSALLSHANIAKTYELGRINDAYFIAMEYVSGRDLRALIDRVRSRGIDIPIGLSLFITAAVLEGLDYAHRKPDLKGHALGIVHRDVSPKNVLVGYSGEVKLIDFGIARAVHHAGRTDVAHGKIGYMAPEQVRGTHVDARSDVFAAGSLLFELLTRTRLFEGPTDTIVLDKVRNAEVLPPSLIAPRVTAELEAIVMRALGAHPDERYPSADAMHRDVVEIMLRRHGHTQARELGLFVRGIFEDEHRQDLARIERAMQIQAMPERIPEHTPSGAPERTALVSLATLAPLIEESTDPEATRFASILPGGVVARHPTRASNVPAIGPQEAATKAMGAPASSAPRPPETAMTPVSRLLPLDAVPPPPVPAPRPQALGDGELTDVDDEPSQDTLVVMRADTTDPRVATRVDAVQALRAGRRDEDDDDISDGDTAIVRTQGTRLAELADARRDENDYTDRIHKSLALLGVGEDSDGGNVLEPTQVGFRAENLQRTASGSSEFGGDVGPAPAASRAPATQAASGPPGSPAWNPAGATSTPTAGAQITDDLSADENTDRMRRESSPSNAAALALAPDADESDSTDRVMRAGGNLDQVPREVTIIDHSRRAAVVEEWAREARGMRRSRLRRTVVMGVCALVIAALAVAVVGWRRRMRPSGPAVGSIVIISQPLGAEVLIDGAVVGTTPFSSPRIAAGRHVVVVRNMAGKQRSLEVTIRAHEVVTREVSLSD